jgi:hypothetical protein
VTSLPGTMQAATTQNAACDGSPGTSTSSGRSTEGRRRTTRPAPSRVTLTSAPASASSSSVWARVATGSRTTVSPAAASPASRTADFTWALATGGCHSIPRRPPPATASGGRQRGPRPSTPAPIARSGSAMRSMGRAESDSSPTSTVRPSSPATTPASSLMPVPEFPQSSGPAAGRSRPPVTRTSPPRRDTPAPSAATAAMVRSTSSPSERPRAVVVPGASAPSSSTRWEIDLSPGVRTVPASGRPPPIFTPEPSRLGPHESTWTVPW